MNNIPAPRVGLIDERNGLMSREWYLFFVSLFQVTGSGTSTANLSDVQVSPEYIENSISNESQLASLMARYDGAIEAAEIGTSPPVQVGTIAAQNADRVAITGGSIAGVTLSTTGGAVLASTSAALTNGAGAGGGTITNAPAAGNPTKWIGINDNGTTRYIPSW